MLLFWPLATGSAQVTGLIENFNDNTLTRWSVSETHQRTFEIAALDSVLNISYHRTATSEEWDVINYLPADSVDMTEYPYISVRIKSDVSVELSLKPKFISGGDDWLEVQIPADNTWHTYLMRIDATPPLVMNKMYLYLDGGSTLTKSGMVYIDDFCFGDLVDTTKADLSALETAIAKANLLYNNTNEGNEEGQYLSGAKSALMAAINTAQNLLDSESLSMNEVEQAVWDLYDACVTFETKVNSSAGGIIDNKATRETRYLYANLKRLDSDYLIFGMHDATGYGVGWSGDDDRSDVKDVCGSYPALYGEDMNKITRNVDVERVRYRVTSAYDRGGVTTFSWHQYDPEGRGFYDEDVSNQNIVKTLLPGGTYHDYYKGKLLTIAKFLKSLRGAKGECIPIIFRPYHEHTGGWFWWGSDECSITEYNAIWQFTVIYLRDSLNVHNVLYALSPAGDDIKSKADYYDIFPGADYIDIFAVDDYFSSNITETEINVYKQMLIYCVQAARDHNKVAALSETGQECLPKTDFFTDALLRSITSDTTALNIAYAMVWRNSYTGHFFAPYPGHTTVPDFLEFYNDPFTLFENNLPDMYNLSSADKTAPQFVSTPPDSFTAVDLEVTLALTTNEKAFLRYGTSDQPYDEMPHDFENGQGTLYHSTTISGSQGERFRFYIRAMDYAGNMSAESFQIDFVIDTMQTPVYWHEPRYTVQDWLVGPALFVFQGETGGNTEINRVRTSYFKKSFEIADASVQKQLIVFITFDNGFVIYLNGHEVDRYCVPAGELGYADWGIVSDKTLITRTLDSNDCKYLVDGENWIAVEVHQALADSTDHRFDLKMIAPDILIDYGASWYYYDAGDQPANRTLGTLSIRSDPEVALPDRLTLYPNYPNPFNAETFIQYYIAHPSEVTVTVYDILGRHVKTLAHGRQNNGIHKIKYDAGNLTSGVYFVKVQAAGEIKVRKMLLLK